MTMPQDPLPIREIHLQSSRHLRARGAHPYPRTTVYWVRPATVGQYVSFSAAYAESFRAPQIPCHWCPHPGPRPTPATDLVRVLSIRRRALSLRPLLIGGHDENTEVGDSRMTTRTTLDRCEILDSANALRRRLLPRLLQPLRLAMHTGQHPRSHVSN